MTDRFIATYF